MVVSSQQSSLLYSIRIYCTVQYSCVYVYCTIHIAASERAPVAASERRAAAWAGAASRRDGTKQPRRAGGPIRVGAVAAHGARDEWTGAAAAARPVRLARMCSLGNVRVLNLNGRDFLSLSRPRNRYLLSTLRWATIALPTPLAIFASTLLHERLSSSSFHITSLRSCLSSVCFPVMKHVNKWFWIIGDKW